MYCTGTSTIFEIHVFNKAPLKVQIATTGPYANISNLYKQPTMHLWPCGAMRTVARVEFNVTTVQRDRRFRVKIRKELLNKIWLFWVAILYRLLNRYRRFGFVKASLFRVVNFSFTTMPTEATNSSIPPINFYKSVLRYAPEKPSVILKSILSVFFFSVTPLIIQPIYS
jgi:hypothetical protein